jgi:hypothetical protein
MSLLMGLTVLALLYQRVKEPQFWRWMTNESRADGGSATADDTPSAVQSKSPRPEPREQIVSGPNETDPDELAKLRSNLKAVQDRQPLQPHEMSAYWRLLGWSRTHPFVELEQLARRDVPYSHLWEEPDLYRGQPIRLKLHVRQVLEYEAKENPLGLKKVYELRGWTDNSLSFPFIVVVPEKPPGIPVGTDVEGDIVFVGYFLKWMGYRAFDTKKNAPLLLGRAKPMARSAGAGKKNNRESAFLILLAGVLVLSFVGWFGLRAWRHPRPTVLAATTVAPERLPDNWISNTAPEPSSELPPAPPSSASNS